MPEDYLTDDEKLEEVKRFLKENGGVLVGGALLGVALFFGLRFYQSRVTDAALAASAAFSAVTNSLDSNDHAKSRQLAEALIKDHAGTPYADQSRLVLARLAVEDGKLNEAVAPLTEVMNGSKDSELRHVARLRLARVLIAQDKPDEAIKTLADPIPTGFAQAFHETRGDAYAAKKDAAAAVNEYQAALAAGEPGGVTGSVVALKIQDLGGTPTPPKTVSIDTQPKAKP